MSPRDIPKSIVPLALIAIAVLGLLAWFLFPSLITSLWILLRMIWVPLVIGGAGLIFALFFSEKSTGFAGFIAASSIVVAGTMFFVMDYQRTVTYSESIEVVKMDEESSELPSFNERQPFAVAEQVSSRTLGNTTGDATGVLKALPLQEEFSTSVNRRGFMSGYESTQIIKVAPYGTTPNENVTFCKYTEEAGERLSNTFIFNSLERKIRHNMSWNKSMTSGDAFVVCEEGKDDELVPHVYVPLTERVGVFNPTLTFGGVAIYNGHTGEVTIENEYDGDYPVYPASLAEVQRKSSHAMGSYADFMFNRAGYDDTSKDAEDPNTPHISDFVVANVDMKTAYYLSPLTSRGDSSSIVGLGTVEANTQMSRGDLKPYTVYEYADRKERPANSAIAASITGEILSGYKSSGLNVFEVIPAADGAWTATVGKDQAILYRAEVRKDGYITLYDSKGNVVGTNAPDEEVEAEPAVEGEGDENTNNNNGNKSSQEISNMSEEEIRDLIQEGVDELIRRGTVEDTVE